MSFIKIIHQIWFQGEENIPQKFLPYINTLKSNNPDFKYILWDDSSLQKLAKNFSDHCYTIYKNYEHMHQKIDLGRYLAIYFYGGISIDMDVHCNISISSLIEPMDKSHDLVVSKLLETSLFHKVYTMQKDIFNNAIIIGFRERSHTLYDMIKELLYKSCNTSESKISCINNTTGPHTFTKLLKKYDNNILVLEPDIIETVCLNNLETCMKDHQNKRGIYHVADNSWMPKHVSIFFKTYVEYNSYYLLDILIIILILYMLYIFYKKIYPTQ
jgi:mannosyltransferase OCH1-like enzyme